MTAVDEELEHEEAFPRLSRELLRVLDAVSERRTLTEGDVLSRAGEVARGFRGDSRVARGLCGSRLPD
jgi:hypothetical protein